MSVVLILLTASLIIAAGFLLAFIWSVRAGQYDDDYTPSVRMLFDDPTGDTKQVSSPARNPETNHPEQEIKK